MKKKLLVKRIFSIIIALALLVSAVPVSLAVQNLLTEETTSKIVREVTELREESVKHFLCEDGSYIAATYSSPVHYQENGEWKEIDNSLSLDRTTLSESGKPTYTTKARGLSVSIPQNFSDGQKITAQNKGYEISFGINSSQKDVSLKTSASVVELDTLSSNTETLRPNTVKSIDNVTTASILDSNDIETYNAELMTVDNQSSAVTYEGIMPDTDFEYIVTSNSIKENIVVYEPQSEYTYSFDMDFDGLAPVINPDNSISLIEPSNPDETIFFIEAPYMYDSNNAESIDIEMSLVSNGDEYVMTLFANAEWINDPERVFPVVIDPTIYLPSSSFTDLFVINGTYANSARVKNELRVGRNLTNITRTYMKISIPTSIQEGSIINNATLSLKKDYYFQAWGQDDIDIQVYDFCHGIGWDPGTVSWNNQPYGYATNVYHHYANDMLDSKPASNDTSTYSFNITKAVERWFSTGVNDGLLIASSDENSKTQIDFHSSRVSNESNRPTMSLNYTPSGIDKTSVNTSSEASSTKIKVTTSKNWTATTNQPWITVSPSTGYGTSSFTINVSENTTTTARTGIVVVTTGNTVIGTVNVIQSGANADIIVEKNEMLFDCKYGSQTISVISNAPWSVSVDSESSSWLNASKDDSGNICVTVSSKTDIGERSGRVIVNADNGTDTEIISVTQLDYINYYFSEIDENGSIINKSSSEYNHLLAQWSMALSYAAYNPIAYQALPFVPSSFMQEPYDDETKTAEAELESMGFYATSYNYDGGYSGCAAHVIGHRNIIIEENSNIIGGNENDFNSNNNADVGNGIINNIFLSSDFSATYRSIGESTSDVLNPTTTEGSANNTRSLVVISVRGSVTPMDWVMDLANQINSERINFETGCQEVLNSLNNYLSMEGISDPIILVTGHSLGAAIANLVAAELNETEGAGDVYSYTFATPNTVNLAYVEETTNYTNIFNFLNNNDLVPHFPMDDLGENPQNVWTRHGQDFHITMPWVTGGIELFDVDMLGVFGHGMPTYYSWINNLTDTLHKDAEEITLADLEGLSEDVAVGFFAKLVKAKCPVSVTLYDNRNNIVAYESQNGEMFTQAILTDAGVVSWITENGEKMFLVPYGSEEFDVHIEAYDYGTMNLTVEQLGVGEPLSSITYNNVNLYPGKEFLVEVSEDILPEDTQLFVTENGEIVSEVSETDPHFKGITAEQTELTYETPIQFTIVTDQTVSEMQLYNRTDDYTLTLVEYGMYVSDVSVVGDNLIWTVGFYPNPSEVGSNIFDISVKSGEEWYDYNNVIAITVLSED